jgi:hypothetical protein
MKTYHLLLVTMITALLIGCHDVIVDTLQEPESWNFPVNATKFAVTLYSEQETVKVGNEFDVKVIFYNIPQVFGTAFDIEYNSDKVKIIQQVTGPYFKSGFSYLSIARVDSTLNTASYGITYHAGLDTTSSGSGVVMKLKCIAKSMGNLNFTIDKQKLEIKKSTGGLINNFNNLLVENLNIVVK